MKTIAVFASGSGTNAENLYQYFEHHPVIRLTTLVSNRKDAGVWDRFKDKELRKILITKGDLESNIFLDQLATVDYIVLAGFLLLLPEKLIDAFTDKIVNIHPSLLPKYGGKGMYGEHVHRAVLDHGEKESGITIHLVNKEYDQGRVLFQSQCQIDSHETIDSLQSKIHHLEHQFFPTVVEKYIMNMGS